VADLERGCSSYIGIETGCAKAVAPCCAAMLSASLDWAAMHPATAVRNVAAALVLEEEPSPIVWPRDVLWSCEYDDPWSLVPLSRRSRPADQLGCRPGVAA
jgi:hypothetical protein